MEAFLLNCVMFALIVVLISLAIASVILVIMLVCMSVQAIKELAKDTSQCGND